MTLCKVGNKNESADEEGGKGRQEYSRGAEVFYLCDVRVRGGADHVAKFLERGVQGLRGEHESDEEEEYKKFFSRDLKEPAENHGRDPADDLNPEIVFLKPRSLQSRECVAYALYLLFQHHTHSILRRMFEVLAASLLVMLVALSGKLTVWRQAGPFIERNLHFFVSFAAGVLLVTIYNLTSEIVEHAGSLMAGVPWILGGAAALLIAFRYLPHFHHHHDVHAEDHAHSRIDARRILVGDGIHNVGDGIVIVAAFAASPFLGIVSTASILVHEMLQEISEFFVLRQAGLSVRTALTYNFLVSSTHTTEDATKIITIHSVILREVVCKIFCISGV